MVDLKLIEKRGGTEEKLRAKFTADQPDEKIRQLIDMNAYRIDEGIQRNLNDARIWYAIDQAFDAANRQITFTLVDGLLAGGMSSEQVLDSMKTMGLTSRLTNMLVPSCDASGNASCDKSGKPVMKLDLPTFFHIFIPLVSAYTKIRWAKLWGDRDIYPLYKYEPVAMTMKNRLRGEIITSRIQRMVQEMGYRDDERQSILQMLKYGVCLNFPSEDFYQEKRTYLDGGKEKTMITKEGVRFEIPHPSRMFWDLNHRLSTANSDTGVEYAGYWNVMRFREVKNNKRFWNTENVQFRYGSWVETKYNFYRELNPCMLKFPQVQMFGPGTGDQERTKEAFRYTLSHQDEGVTVVPYFQKLIPSEWGLFDHDEPIWMRFIHTGSHTVSHAVPLAYNPLVAYLYDADLGVARPSSLSLELLPFQDHMSNLLTQYLLTVKQSLERVIFWNADIVDQKYVDLINNLGEKKYRGMTFIPYSRREVSWQQQSEKDAFTPVNLHQTENAPLIANAVMQLINVMERMLGYSSQEVGAPATHEQTAEEVQVISANTTTRIQLTDSFIDSAVKARKKLLYEAFMAYSSDEVLSEVADLDDERKAALKDLGFTVEDETSAAGAKSGIKGDKKSLRLDGFASDRDGSNRIVDTKLAATMIQTFQSIFSNPVLAQAAGLQQLMDLFNQILVYSGAPKDFRLRVQPQQPQPSPEEAQKAQAEQLQAVQQQLAQMASQIVDGKMNELAAGLKQNLVDPMKANAQQTAAAIQGLADQQGKEAQLIARLYQIIGMAQQDPNADVRAQEAGFGDQGQGDGLAPQAGGGAVPQMPLG
jgi:hypothetical protein